MDDLTITAKSVPKERWILEDLVELTDWARMEFKPEKSRSLVLRRARVQNRSDQSGHHLNGPRETGEELG